MLGLWQFATKSRLTPASLPRVCHVCCRVVRSNPLLLHCCVPSSPAGHLVALRREAIGDARVDKAWQMQELQDKLWAAIR